MASPIKFRDAQHEARAMALREQIKHAGLTIAQFQRRAGFSRNVAYAISKGRLTTPEEQQRIDAALSLD